MVVLRAVPWCGVVLLGVVSLGASSLGSACAAAPPAFVLDDNTDVASGTPRVLTSATADGAHATLTLTLQDVGPAFGVSMHVVLANTLRVESVELMPVLGSDDAVVPVQSTQGGDTALGAVRSDVAEQDIGDGPFATIALATTDGAPVRVVVERALARRSDGAFVPLAAQSGVLTLEAP